MIYAIHEHELLPNVDSVAYRREVAEAIGKMNIPGLRRALHLKGVRGERVDKYVVLWIFESVEALTLNFGTPEQRKIPADWLAYENGVLAKYLDRHPDTIQYTDYQVIDTFNFPELPKSKQAQKSNTAL